LASISKAGQPSCGNMVLRCCWHDFRKVHGSVDL